MKTKPQADEPIDNSQGEVVKIPLPKGTVIKDGLLMNDPAQLPAIETFQSQIDAVFVDMVASTQVMIKVLKDFNLSESVKQAARLEDAVIELRDTLRAEVERAKNQRRLF